MRYKKPVFIPRFDEEPDYDSRPDFYWDEDTLDAIIEQSRYAEYQQTGNYDFRRARLVA